MDFTRTRSIAAHVAAASAMMVCFAIVAGVGRIESVVVTEQRVAAEPTASTWTTASLEPVEVKLAPAPEPAAPEAEPELVATVVAELPPPIVVNDIASIAASFPDAPPPLPGSEVVGLWAPDAGSCSPKSFQQGNLPTIINNEGAWAGETFCLFKNRRPTGSGWRVTAECSGDNDRWTTQVRLSVKGEHLTWESKRGRQVYTRCGTDVRMASAP